MLRHLHQMVPAVAPVKRKRKADHHRHSTSTSLCKRPAPPRHELDLPFDRACSLHGPGLPRNAGAVDSSRRGVVNGSNLHCCPGELFFAEDERETTSTDDESELSSMDGRSSPSHPAVSWGPAGNQGAQGFVEATAECFQTPLGVGFATPRAVETPTAAATTAVSTRGRRVCSGEEPTGANCLLYGGAPISHHQHQQQHQQHQQEEVYESQEQQQQYQGQGHGKRQVQDGGRSDADVWGWFVDAGEDQPSRANVQNGGVRYY